MRSSNGLRYWPWEKKLSVAASPRTWSIGVVQVREVLDLRNRQQPGQPGAQRQSQDRLLVEQRVEHPGRAEPAQQPAGHPVDPALARHVLAEHQHAGPGGHRVGERGIDRLGQGERPR